jgi:hypothetical protein
MVDTEAQARLSARSRPIQFAAISGRLFDVRHRLVLIFVGLAHLLTVNYLWSARIVIQTPQQRATSTLILLPTSNAREQNRTDLGTLVARNPPHIPAPRVVATPPEAPLWEDVAPEASSPITDWTQAARLAAARAVADSRHTRGQGGGAGPNVQQPATKPARTVHWSHASTHRIERAEDGTIIVWINDRCFLVGFLIPVCAIGEIKARGDLFDGMRDPEAEQGDLP